MNTDRRGFLSMLSGAVAGLVALVFGKSQAEAVIDNHLDPRGFDSRTATSLLPDPNRKRLRIYEAAPGRPYDQAKAWLESVTPTGSEIVADSCMQHWNFDSVTFKVRHPAFELVGPCDAIPIFYQSRESTLANLDRPNPTQTWFQFWCEADRQRELTGAYVIWNVKTLHGKIVELFILPSLDCYPKTEHLFFHQSPNRVVMIDMADVTLIGYCPQWPKGLS